jgi:hypothetical protein
LRTLSAQVDDELIHEEILSHRHLTSINEYSVLGFLDEEFPYKLLDILKIEGTPLIYQNSVLECVERFAIESGNLDLINSSYHATSGVVISYCINQKGRTFSGGVQRGSSRPEKLDVFDQSREDYENDTLRFDPERQDFFYAPIHIPFQAEIENAKWTCLCRMQDSNKLNGRIYQYPELGNILKQGVRDIEAAARTSDRWIQEVARQNPKCRGFLLYGYQFISDATNSFLGCGIPALGVTRQAPSPYLRFAHIRNESGKRVNFESLQIRHLQKHPHQLTDITNRSQIIKQGEIINEEVNIMLLPGQDILIPIEFGFDTKSHLKYTSGLEDSSSPEWVMDELQVLIAKPVSREIINSIKSSDYLRSTEQINQQYLADWTHLSQDFTSQTKPVSDLKYNSPKRFAVGSFFDIKSIKLDGKDLAISSPNDNPKISISTYFQYGSCPYLITFNSRKGYWIERGTILYGRQNEQMEGGEIYAIDEETSRIKIEEHDCEITFLSSLSLIYIDQNSGSQSVVECLTSNLPRNGKGYYLLHEGESIELDINNLLPKTASKIQLKVVGYYEILKSQEVDILD